MYDISQSPLININPIIVIIIIIFTFPTNLFIFVTLLFMYFYLFYQHFNPKNVCDYYDGNFISMYAEKITHKQTKFSLFYFILFYFIYVRCATT